MAARFCRMKIHKTISQIRSYESRSNLAPVSWPWIHTEQIPRNACNLSYSFLRNFHTSLILDGVTPIKMPSLSPTMTEGTIVKWCKKEGDPIAAGDVLCEIQTDKAVVSLEFDEDGILAKVLMPENSVEIKVGTPIALMVDEGEDWQNVEIPKDLDVPSSEKPEAPKPTQSTPKISSPPAGGETKPGHIETGVLLGPAARSLLQLYGLASNNIKGHGPHGTLMKGDILRYVAENKIHPVDQAAEVSTTAKKAVSGGKKESPSAYQDVDITSMRRTIAKRLLQSKTTIAHAYSTTECSINNMISLRKKMSALGMKTSVNDFIVKSVANALGKCPAVNVVWEGNNLTQKGQIDISVAVATDSGLITPIVTNVGDKDVIQISEAVKILAEKARNGKLQPQEFMGGTFTISNLGMFGIHHFSAIINPPQCAILAVGGGVLSIDEVGRALTTVGLTLSYDASAITEEASAKFLANLKHELENPTEISMGVFHLQSRQEMIDLFN